MIARPAESALGTAFQLESLLSAFARWRYRDAFLLGVMVVSMTAFNTLWATLDSGRVYWDTAHHLGDSILYRDTFSAAHPIRFIETYSLYPPLVTWITALFYPLFGTAIWVAILSMNLVFLSMLVLATYGIGKLLWNGRVGLLSALFVSTTPLILSLFHQYMLDSPLTAIVALALYLLIRSDNFADRTASLLLGVTCGLGLLIKWTVPFFLALPVIASVVTAALRSRSERSNARLFNVAAGAILTVAIAATWYIPNWAQFKADTNRANGLPPSLLGSPPVRSLASLLWYAWNLLNTELYLIPFLFFVAGVVFIFRKDEAARRNAPLLLSIISSYLAFTLLAIKDFRYTMPMLPAVAVVATSWLEYLKPKTRHWLSGALTAYCIIAFLVISFGTGLLPKDISIHLEPRSFTSDLVDVGPPQPTRVQGIVVFAQHGFRVGAPSTEQWHQEDPFREMVARGGERTFAYAGQPFETIWFTTWGLRYYALKYRFTWVVQQQAHFLIVRGPPTADVTRGFTQVDEYQLPYGGPLRLYQRV